MEDWSRIFAEHSQAVWQVACRLLGNQADAADCMQEAFVTAVKVSCRQPVRNWSALLRRLATTKALDRLRQRFRQQRRLVAVGDLPEVTDPTADPSQQAQADELAEAMRKAMARLPQQQAAVFCLRFFDDLAYEQIAEALGLKTVTVGVLLHRAKTALRKMPEMADWLRKTEVQDA